MLLESSVIIFDLVDKTSRASINHINGAVRLAPDNDPGTDHTEQIISFSNVGSAVGSDPPAWYCVTTNPSGVVWQFPNGSDVPIGIPNNPNTVADGNELFITGLTTPVIAVALHRGSTHFSPDGEHCCVRVAHGSANKKCLTFSECRLLLLSMSNTNPHAPPQLPAPY